MIRPARPNAPGALRCAAAGLSEPKKIKKPGMRRLGRHLWLLLPLLLSSFWWSHQPTTTPRISQDWATTVPSGWNPSATADGCNHAQGVVDRSLRQGDGDDDHHNNNKDFYPLDADAPFVHVVHSRFMQFQPHLLSLGEARQQLFEVFCLPTMVRQSTRNFLWIIRIDPDLNEQLLRPLIAALTPHRDRFFLIASNDNGPVFRDWKEDDYRDNGVAATANNSVDRTTKNETILLGNPVTLRRAIREAQTKWTIETRLDLDDGLHPYLLQHIQHHVTGWYQHHQYHIQRLKEHQPKQQHQESQQPEIPWPSRALCVDYNILWLTGLLLPEPTLKENDKKNDQPPPAPSTQHLPPEGLLRINRGRDMCVTPGLTFVEAPFPADAATAARLRINRTSHHLLHKKYPQCYKVPPVDSAGQIPLVSWMNASTDDPSASSLPCFEYYRTGWPQAVQARTPTSAGLGGYHKVWTPDSTAMYHWNILAQVFGIDPNVRTPALVRYLRDHLGAIARDNLAGQCCTPFAERVLQNILRRTKTQGTKM